MVSQLSHGDLVRPWLTFGRELYLGLTDCHKCQLGTNLWLTNRQHLLVCQKGKETV
jgi:hypothetical protein